MPTHLQLRQRVSRRLDQPLVAVNKGAGSVDDIPLTNVYWTRQMVSDWLNEGYNQMYSEIAEIEAPTLVDETDGTYTAGATSMSLWTLLSITDDPLNIAEVRDRTSASANNIGTLIPFQPHQQFARWREQISGGLAQSNNSRFWTFRDYNPMRIEIYPIPAAGVSLRVRYIPAVPLNPSSGIEPALRVSTDADPTGDADTPLAIPTAHHSILIDYACAMARQREQDPSWREEMASFTEKLHRFRESVEERQIQGSRETFVSEPAEYSSGDRRHWYGWP